MSITTARVRVSAERDWYEPYAISLGIRVGNLVFVSGQAAVDEEAAGKIEELFRSIVVVRGSTPMPPRDLIPL